MKFTSVVIATACTAAAAAAAPAASTKEVDEHKTMVQELNTVADDGEQRRRALKKNKPGKGKGFCVVM